MSESHRQIKRLIIIAIYLIIVFGLSFLIYSCAKPKETCYDKIKNQNEEDVDCGGVCPKCRKIEAEKIEMISSGIVDSGSNGKADAYCKISNPNQNYGSQKFDYEFHLYDAAGSVTKSIPDRNFILPGEEKYLVAHNIETGQPTAKVDCKINSSEWVEFSGVYEKPALKIINRRYNESTTGVGFSEVKALLKNESPYDFNLIRIQVILKDNSGNIIALNSTEMRTVKAGEEREFQVSWPNKFSGNVTNLEMQPEVNILDSDAFFQRYYKNFKFQNYE